MVIGSNCRSKGAFCTQHHPSSSKPVSKKGIVFTFPSHPAFISSYPLRSLFLAFPAGSMVSSDVPEVSHSNNKKKIAVAAVNKTEEESTCPQTLSPIAAAFAAGFRRPFNRFPLFPSLYSLPLLPFPFFRPPLLDPFRSS